MTQRFVSCDREQVLLMPVSLRDWLPESRLAWFVLAAVEELDLSAFYAAYRQDANGRYTQMLWMGLRTKAAYLPG